MNIFRKKRMFFIGDLHLDHKNIIRYCKRPFKSVRRMNKTLISNWNKTVKSGDVIYYLGDLAFGKGSRSTGYWLRKLNGKIIFLKGNHHKSKRIRLLKNTILRYKGKKFYITHDPKDVPKKWKGWAICGHHHNNYPKKFPLINKKTKRINVSVEMINYKPIEINGLLKKIS